MKLSRRFFLTTTISLVTAAGCSGVQRRPAPRISSQGKTAGPSNRSIVLGRASEAGPEVVGPQVSSRVDPEPPAD